MFAVDSTLKASSLGLHTAHRTWQISAGGFIPKLFSIRLNVFVHVHGQVFQAYLW